jgi:DNA-binding transcriptional MocR family regulator
MTMPIMLNRAAPGTLKDKLREEILRQIRGGDLQSGERLPPTRHLADDLGLNRGTVSAVYDELVTEGVLFAHVGRGTFVNSDSGSGSLGVAGIPAGTGPLRWTDHFTEIEAVPRERALLAQAAARGSADLISFAGLVPDESLYPVEAFGRALAEALRELGAPLLAYGPPDGHAALLDYLRSYLAQERGVRLGDNELLAVNGSQQALNLLARAFLRPGDTVLVEDPSYYGALEIFRSYGARLVGVPIDSQGMVVEGLEAALARERPKLLYIMPTFQNPTGTTLAPGRREVLVRLARHHEVPVIEDDFDGELYYDAPPPPPLKSLPESEAVIYIGTASKMLFPGLRIGWVAGADPVIRRLSRIKQVSDLSGSQLLQVALTRFAQTGELKRHMPIVRKAYRLRMERLLAALGKHMPEGVSWSRPRGGLSVLVSLPPRLDAGDLLEESIARGVVFTPGRLFFVNDGANHLRLSIGRTALEQVEPGVTRLGGVLRSALDRTGPPGRRERSAALPPV